MNSDRALERTQMRSGTTLTQSERQSCGRKIANRDGGYFCFYCKDPLISDFHVDHKIPIAKGGSHSLDNMVLACMPCNQEKHAKDIDEYRVWRRSRRLSLTFSLWRDRSWLSAC
jgi:5-methylcytosine-specific restriction endonuclease McrA